MSLTSYVPFENNPYHKDCLKALHAKNCTFCNKMIEGDYYEVGDGTAYVHEECVEKYKRAEEELADKKRKEEEERLKEQ